MPRARRLQLTPQLGLPGEKQQPEGTLGKAPLSTSGMPLLACDVNFRLRRSVAREELQAVLGARSRIPRRARCRQRPLARLAGHREEGARPAQLVGWRRGRSARSHPACRWQASVRHARPRPESDGSGFDPCRFVVTHEKAHLSSEHVPRLVVRLVKMKRRHVSGRPGELHDGHLTARLLRQADAYEVREEPARLGPARHCR